MIQNRLNSQIATLFISHLFMDFMLGIWPIYKTIARLDLTKAGIIAGIGMFFGELSQLYFGALSDKGHQKALGWLGILLTGSLGFLAFTNNYFILFVLILFTYVGSSAFHPAATKMVISWSKTYKGRTFSLFYCGGMIGAAISQLVFTHSYEYFGGNTLLLLIPILLLTLWLANHPFPSDTSSDRFSFKEAIQKILPHKKKVTALYSLQLSTQALIALFCFFLPENLIDREFDKWFALGGAYFCFVIGEATMTLFAGYIADYYSPKAILISASTIAFLLLNAFFMSNHLTLPIACFMLLGLGGSIGLIPPTVISTGHRVVPHDSKGMISSLLMGGTSAFAGIGMILLGGLGSTAILATIILAGASIFFACHIQHEKPCLSLSY